MGTGDVFGIHIYPAGKTMDSVEYERLLREEVLPELRQLNPTNPGSLDNLIFMQVCPALLGQGNF